MTWIDELAPLVEENFETAEQQSRAWRLAGAAVSAVRRQDIRPAHVARQWSASDVFLAGFITGWIFCSLVLWAIFR